jgi:glycogen(starch) synthase
VSSSTFSVVICSDGRLPFLKTTLRALRGVDYAPPELVLVAGPSADGTREFVETLRDQAKVTTCPERNLSRARNRGLALAAGEIVVFLDDDALPEAEWLADLAAAYESDPNLSAAGGIVYDPSGLTLQARYVTLDRLGYPHELWRAPAPELNYPFSAEFPHLLGANCSFRREALLALGGFDEEYEFFLDESDVLARLNDSGGRIAQLPRAAVHHKFAASANRSARRVYRHWRPLIKNRVYFGLRNGARHHTPFEILRAALDDAELWRVGVANDVARGDLTAADAERFEAEAIDGIAAGLAAGRAPQRKLLPSAPPPAPFRPFPLLRPEGAKLCIALVSQDYLPGHNGGIARNTAELAAAWARLGHEVHVFTRARAAPSLDYEDGVWVHRAAPVSGGRPPDLGLGEEIPQEIWDHSATMRAEVEALAARRRVDFVYAPLWDAEPVAFLAQPGFRLVCALQTTMDFWLDSQPQRRRDPDWMSLRGRPILALESWCLRKASLLHANSHAIVEDISLRYRLTFETERLAYAPHGLADVAAPAPVASEGLRFLFVGRLESRKGIDLLLAAAPDVLRQLPGARLDIVGDDAIADDEGATYRQAFEAPADIEGRIAFHGRVEEAALSAHYSACDVLVAPSRYESFGLVYAEGMRAGKPVIAGQGGGGGEVVEAGICGLLVPPGDVAALAAAMLRLGRDADLRREMGAAGRRRYEASFTADIAARTLLDAIMARTPPE